MNETASDHDESQYRAATGTAGPGSSSCRPYSWLTALIIIMTLIALLAGGLSLRYLKGRLVESTGKSLALAAVSAADSLDQMLADRLEDKGRDFLLRVIRGAQQLGKLMEDLLALSRAQRMDLPAEEVESEGLVQEVLRQLEGHLKQTGATVNVAKNLPRLLANSPRATQRIYNLIANALKFRREGEAPDIEIAPYQPIGTDGAKVRVFVRSCVSGAYSYICKPVDLGEFTDMVTHFNLNLDSGFADSSECWVG